jgi:protein-tyrosine phosphatase
LKKENQNFLDLMYLVARFRFINYKIEEAKKVGDVDLNLKMEYDRLSLSIASRVDSLKIADNQKYGKATINSILLGDESIYPLPFERSYWIIPGFLMAGEIPSSRLKKERIQKLKRLIHSGVQSIVNLMESEEFDFNGKKLVDYSLELQEIANINKVEITINRFEIVDLGIPERAFMADILTHIQTCLLNEQTLYIHCWGGIGRTGTTVGCFLVNEGICSNSEVLDFINFLKRNTNIALRNSPETLEQMAFIENWQ